MTIIILLIGISLCIAVLFLGIFLWNMKSGQYEDTYTPSVRMLFEDKTDHKNRLDSKTEKLDKNQVSS